MFFPSYGSQRIERTQAQIDAELNAMRSAGAKDFKKRKAKRKAADRSRKLNR